MVVHLLQKIFFEKIFVFLTKYTLQKKMFSYGKKVLH